jgi:hypothetical protein
MDEIGELFTDAGFYILCAVGYVVFFIMIFILKGMEYSNLFTWWIKIIVIIAIPVIAGFMRFAFDSDR